MSIYDPNSAVSGDLQIDYEKLVPAGERTTKAGELVAGVRAGAATTADTVPLYPQDPLATKDFDLRLHNVQLALDRAASELDELGAWMVAIGKAADFADNLPADRLPGPVLDERGQLDQEAALILLLMQEGETQLAIEAGLFGPEDFIEFTITADGRVRVWKVLDVGLEGSASLTLERLPEGSDDRYQLSVSGDTALFGGAHGSTDNAGGQAQLGVGPTATVIFRSDDAADLASNVEDVKTIVVAQPHMAASVAKTAGGFLIPGLGVPIAVREAQKFEEQRARAEAALRDLAEDYDAIEVGYHLHAGAQGDGDIAVPIFGTEVQLNVGAALDIEIDQDAEIIYRYERHGGDKIVYRSTNTVAGSAGPTVSGTTGQANQGGVGVVGSENGTIEGTISQEVEYDIESGGVTVTLRAEGHVGVELAQKVELSTNSSGPFAEVGHATDLTVGRRYTVVLEPQRSDVGQVLEALETGDLEQALTAAGGTRLEVSEVRTASESVSAEGGVENLAEVSVGATATVGDVDQVSLWEPPEPPAPPTVEPPIPEIVIEDPPPQPEAEPPEPKGKDTSEGPEDNGMTDDELVNDLLGQSTDVLAP